MLTYSSWSSLPVSFISCAFEYVDNLGVSHLAGDRPNRGWSLSVLSPLISPKFANTLNFDALGLVVTRIERLSG